MEERKIEGVAIKPLKKITDDPEWSERNLIQYEHLLDKKLRMIKIPKKEYENLELKHIFLAGELQRKVPHRFIKDNRLEFILCRYNEGDHGEYHRHPYIDEYEIVIDGKMGYKSAFTGEYLQFEKGDFIHIPAGLCVRRIVIRKSQTLTIKVPSRDDKITCNICPWKGKCIKREDEI